MQKRSTGFITRCASLDDRTKLRVLLVMLGAKPATFARLKITPKNLHDKHRFEDALKQAGLVFEVSAAKGFEQISRIKDGHIRWSTSGTWYGYDIFCDENHRARFHEYATLSFKEKHAQADKLAGTLYGYPSCCIKSFVKEEDTHYLAKNYSYFSYFDERAKKAQAFPLITHTACSMRCKHSRTQNTRFRALLRKHAAKWFERFSKKKVTRTKLVVDNQADIYLDSDQSVWLQKDGHQYQCISLQKIDQHFVAISHLQRQSLEIGTVFDAEVTIQYDYPSVRLLKITGFLPDVRHERDFAKSH